MNAQEFAQICAEDFIGWVMAHMVFAEGVDTEEFYAERDALRHSLRKLRESASVGLSGENQKRGSQKNDA